MTRYKKQTQAGFTLIELMIVVAIVGILATLAIPAYQDYVARAQMSEALVLADGLKTPVSESFAQEGVCPANTSAVDGIDVAGNIKGSYVSSVATAAPATTSTTGGCTITATMNTTGISAGLVSKTLTLTLATGLSSNTWACKSNAAQKYLPKACTFSAT